MILDDLIHATSINLAKRRSTKSLEKLIDEVAQLPIVTHSLLETQLRQPEISVIAEIKQASPSKGQIVVADDFNYLKFAREYEDANVAAISVLTEENYFKGSLDMLKNIVNETNTPVLRKDFTIDPYMIYEAKAAGASIILLIVAILNDKQLYDYLALATELGMSVIVEAHDEEEVYRAIAVGAKIIGVNNRNLKDFTVDFNNTKRLRELVPVDILFVSESGIQNHSDVVTLKEAGVNGILVGETFMRANDKKAQISELLGIEYDKN